jgi:serine kinase of HPr protein (carbohydrate metabolism regulator)
MASALMAAYNATCVALDGRGLLIEGPAGSGKSSLALALIDRGARLVGDDGVFLENDSGRLLARPHPRTRGLLEIRNVGIVKMLVCERVPVCLVLRLDENAPRFVEEPLLEKIEAANVPVLPMWPASPVLALRAEAALSRFGLTG